jgi:hypothetical protein
MLKLVLGGVDGNLHFPVPSMKRLNQTEQAPFYNFAVLDLKMQLSWNFYTKNQNRRHSAGEFRFPLTRNRIQVGLKKSAGSH